MRLNVGVDQETFQGNEQEGAKAAARRVGRRVVSILDEAGEKRLRKLDRVGGVSTAADIRQHRLVGPAQGVQTGAHPGLRARAQRRLIGLSRIEPF